MSSVVLTAKLADLQFRQQTSSIQANRAWIEANLLIHAPPACISDQSNSGSRGMNWILHFGRDGHECLMFVFTGLVNIRYIVATCICKENSIWSKTFSAIGDLFDKKKFKYEWPSVIIQPIYDDLHTPTRWKCRCLRPVLVLMNTPRRVYSRTGCDVVHRIRCTVLCGGVVHGTQCCVVVWYTVPCSLRHRCSASVAGAAI